MPISTIQAIGQATFAAAAATTATNNINTNPSSSTIENGESWQQQQQNRRPRYSIYEMNAAIIETITDIDDLSDLVHQVEGMSVLDAADVGPLLLPLTRLTSMKRYGATGAALTERLLWTCLSRLPPHVPDRYNHNNSNTTASPYHSSQPTQSLSTSDGTSSSAVPQQQQRDNYSDNETTVSSSLEDAPSSSGPSPRALDPSVYYNNHTGYGQLRTSSYSVATADLMLLPYPTVAMYNRAMIAWGNCATPAAAERAEALFQVQWQEYQAEYQYLLSAAAASSSSSSSSSSREALPSQPYAAPPDRRCFKSLIRAWGVSQHPNGAARAHEILCLMERLAGIDDILIDKHQNSKQKNELETPLPYFPAIDMPDIGTYNVVLSAYAKLFVLKHPNALKRVLEIVQRLHNLRAITGSDKFVLDGYSYVSILQAYSRYIQFCQSPMDPRFTHGVLSLIETIHSRIRDESMEPPSSSPVSSFNKKDLDNSDRKRGADQKFLYPLSITFAYGVAVEALVKTNSYYETTELANDILLAMMGERNRINTAAQERPSSSYSSTNRNPNHSIPPIFIPYDICTNVWPTHDMIMRVIQAWERSGVPQANERIDHLLSTAVDNTTFKRTFVLNAALETWCLSNWKGAPEVMERILRRALERSLQDRTKPTGETFALVMKGWMRSKLVEAPIRAELLLRQFLALYEDQNDTWYKPREVHVRYVLTCWLSRCKDMQRYEGISGESMYPAEHGERLVLMLHGRPWFEEVATGQFAMALRLWAMQQFPDNDISAPNFVQRASRLFDVYSETLAEGELGSAYPANWVLEACKRKQPTLDRRREAYEVAIQTFQRCNRNARTYTLTVQVLHAQVETLDEEHLKVIEDLCKQCCASGMLTQDMISMVAATLSAEALQRLFGLSFHMAQLLVDARATASSSSSSSVPSALLVGNLPQEWSSKAISQNKPKTSKATSARSESKPEL